MECFYQNGLQFSCKRCSVCCRLSSGYVYLSQTDLTKLALWFNLKKDLFIRNYCRWVPYGDSEYALCLKELENFDCILWHKDGGCSAYNSRPLQCSLYPFWSVLVKSRSNWENASKDCPGIGSGEIHSLQEISEKVNAYDNNKPVLRNEYFK